MSEATDPYRTRPSLAGLSLSRDALARNWGWLLALGILHLILGTLAIVVPLAAALAVEIVLGILFLVGGIMQLIQAFRCRGWRSVLPQALGGLLAVAAGLLLLFFPLAGVLSLTLVVAALFVVGGLFRIVTAVQNRDVGGWIWMLFSGLLGVVLGVVIWLGWPGTAVWVLGLLVGLELIFEGWAMVMLALAARRFRSLPPPPPGTAAPTPA